MEHDEIIEKLKAARENIAIAANMFDRVKGYQESILEAKENIDAALYELTGSDFYRKAL